jgi:acyl-CoA synthetase (AMP-forming)/AMP-acid ligase II
MSAPPVPSPLARIPFLREAQDPHGACVSDDYRTLDNAAFAEAVRRLTHRFEALGVSPGDTVAVLLPNCSEIVTTMFAAWSRGAAMVPVNPALTDDEARYQLEDSTAALIVGDQRADTLAKSIGTTWVDVRSIHAPPASAAPEVQPLAGGSDFALVIYTSGTTGRPKGVLLDHTNLEAMSTAIIDTFTLTAEDTSLLILPLFHVNGLVISVLSVLRAGGRVVVGPRFSAGTFWDLVETHRPTFFSAVPTIYAVLDARTEREVDTSSLRFVVCGAAPMPAELITRFEERFRVPVVEGYGLSEGSVASTINPLAGPRKPGTVGVALPGQEVAILSPEGERRPQGQRGEVAIRGANVMRGYLGKPEETATVIRDGWLHTGDVGYLDPEGYLVLVDRIKDMIIRGGENIYPKEIEECLYGHAAVLEAAVVGSPDPVYGEVPIAFIATKPGMTLTSQELLEHCAASLARFKVPAAVHIRTQLPKNSVGKLVKGLLRDQVRP